MWNNSRSLPPPIQSLKHSTNDLNAFPPKRSDRNRSEKTELVRRTGPNQIETIWPNWFVGISSIQFAWTHKYSRLEIRNSNCEGGLRLSINCNKRSKNRNATQCQIVAIFSRARSSRKTRWTYWTAELLSDWMNGSNDWLTDGQSLFVLHRWMGAWLLKW